MVTVTVPPFFLHLRLFSSPGTPDALPLAKPNLINFAPNPTAARIAGASISVSGGTALYETVGASKGVSEIARFDSPEVIARHPDNLGPRIAVIEGAPDMPANPIAADQVRATRIQEYVKVASTQIAATK